jgi:hypothetical protein
MGPISGHETQNRPNTQRISNWSPLPPQFWPLAQDVGRLWRGWRRVPVVVRRWRLAGTFRLPQTARLPNLPRYDCRSRGRSVDPYNNAARLWPSPRWSVPRALRDWRQRARDAAVQTLATGERREVPGSAVQSPAAPFWSPDSRQIVYVHCRPHRVRCRDRDDRASCVPVDFPGGSWNRDGVILLGSAAASVSQFGE